MATMSCDDNSMIAQKLRELVWVHSLRCTFYDTLILKQQDHYENTFVVSELNRPHEEYTVTITKNEK